MNTVLRALKRPGGSPALFNDRVFVLMMLLLAALFWVDRHQAALSLYFIGRSLLHISPFFLLAILFAAYANASGADRLIARTFSGNTRIAIVGGSLAGALSPFCSCGVIPVIAGMLASGVPLAPVMAFCMASPIMDPEMFILTAAGINIHFAVAKTVTAIGMGLLAGWAVLGLQHLGYLRHPLKKANGCGCGPPSFDPRAATEITWRIWQDPAKGDEFRSHIRANGLFLGKWMALAFLMESLMIAYIPTETVAGIVGMDNPMAIPVSAMIGIPAYLNGYAAIPFISGLMELGMTPGAALSFVTAGAVSSIPAALAVYALVQRSVFLAYLGIGLTGSMAAGYLFEFLRMIA